MNSDKYIPTDTKPVPIDEQLAALVLKRAPGAAVHKRALDALRTLQERNRMLMREREGAREDAAKYQRAAAELSDKLHGTPCAEIRWMQDRDALRADITKLETAHGQNMREIDRLRAELEAARKEADGVAQEAADLCTQYCNERDALRAELAKHEAQIADLARRYEDDLSALRAELAAAQEEIDAYKMDGSSAAMEVAELKGRLQVTRAERDALRAELAAERKHREHETKRADANHESLTKHWLSEGKLRRALRDNVPNWLFDRIIAEIENARIDAALVKGGGNNQ